MSGSMVSRPLLMVCLVMSVSLVQAKTLIFESNESRSGNPSSVATEPYKPVAAPQSVQASGVSSQALSEMYFLVEQLKREVQELRAIVEEQTFKLNNLEESGKRRYRDIDQRVLSLSKKVASGGGVSVTDASKTISTATLSPEGQSISASTTAPSTVVNASVIVPVQAQPKPVSGEERQAYDAAYAFVKNKQFDDAIDSLHGFVEKYPDSDLAGNAYYWLGEVYLVVPKLEQAKQAFSIVLQAFPNHRKLPDSIFKLGVTYDRLLDADNSEKYLKMVQEKFPNSTASKLAKNYKIAR